MTKKVMCDECKYELDMAAVKIEETEILLNGEKMTLSYFVCPNCRKIYKVCLSDKKYKNLVEDLEATKKRVVRSSGNGNIAFAKTLSKMVLKKVQRIKAHLSNLNGKYPGTFVFNNPDDKEDDSINYLP